MLGDRVHWLECDSVSSGSASIAADLGETSLDNVGRLSVPDARLVLCWRVLLDISALSVGREDIFEGIRRFQRWRISHLMKLPLVDCCGGSYLHEGDDQLLTDHFDCQFIGDSLTVDLARQRCDVELFDSQWEAHLCWNGKR